MSRAARGWILALDHFTDTALRRAELVNALTDQDHGLPLELKGHRDLVPDRSLGLVLLKSPDGTAALQLRYDREEFLAKDREAQTAAVRRRISKVSGEALLAPMPYGDPTG